MLQQAGKLEADIDSASPGTLAVSSANSDAPARILFATRRRFMQPRSPKIPLLEASMQHRIQNVAGDFPRPQARGRFKHAVPRMDTSTQADITYAPIGAETVRRKIPCPMCGRSFPLPSEWTRPPFRCSWCHEQLQAKVRYAGIFRYLYWIVVAPLSLPVLMNYDWRSYIVLLSGSLVIFIFAGFVSAAVFPLDVARYESSVGHKSNKVRPWIGFLLHAF